MIPLIRALLRADAEVILASKGKAGELLKTEFPDLPFYDLPSCHHTLFAKEDPRPLS